MALATMQFEFGFGPRHARVRAAPGRRRLLVIADLGGARTVPLAERSALAVDVDSFSQIFARLLPSVSIDVDGMALAIGFESIDDFHPDRLFARLPVFDALRRLRAELANPAQFRRAAAALGLSASAAQKVPPAAAADAAADIERLLGHRPTRAAGVEPATQMLERWLHDLVAPHVLPDTAGEQRALIEAADGAIAALMRRVLRHRHLQTLEAAWLGIDRLVRGLELGEGLELALLDAGADEIEADVTANRADLAGSALHRHLYGAAQAAPDAGGWTLWVLDRDFGPTPAEVQLLAALGAIAARAGAPLIAGAKPQTAGCASRLQLGDPCLWKPAEAPELTHLAALRAAPMAHWIGLVLPRVLMRLPYGGSSGKRIASFDFEELPVPPEHDAYLWGCGALAAALLAGRALQSESMDLDSELHLDDLPSHIVREPGGAHQQPCAELLLGEEAGAALLARGLMPLLSWRDRPAVRLLRWQSMAAPTAPLRGISGGP